ncbi:MAG: hypothetical protein KIG84_10110 [Bacteroidales bacterium]|nr:hypothetical protein [Bacteroidales bacterium]
MSEVTKVTFANDFSDELKARIKDEATKRIDTLCEANEFSMNDLAQLTGVSHGSIKGRAHTMTSATQIVEAILSGSRSNGGKRKASVESVKSFIDSLDADARAKFLAELGLAQV